MNVNVTIEELAPCKKLLRVEVDAGEVDKEFDSMTRNFQRQAALPGFRPGKAPREMVLRKYEKDIEQEVKKKLIPAAYKKAVEEKKLEVVGTPDLEEIQFGRGQALQFAVTLETAPEVQLPEYKGLPVKRELATVTDADVERALDLLRERHANFETVQRPLQPGDVAVVSYTGTCEGKPITEIAPTARGLTEKKNFWIEARPGSFIPGFSEQLIGAQAGDKRTVTVDFPADFVTPQLAGRKGVYEVELVEVKQKALPPLDDAFGKTWGAESLEKLREGVRRDLENELKYKQDRSVRGQVIRGLLERVNFGLPQSAVMRETRNVVYDIVRENTQRGISREQIEKQKDEIYSVAAHSAKDRVKLAFLVQKIAEKEDLKVSEEEIGQRIQQMAALYDITPEKFLKDLQKRDGVIEIYDQIAHEKVIDFLVQHARVEDVPAKPEETPAVNPS